MLTQRIDWDEGFNVAEEPFLSGIPILGFQSVVIRRIRRVLKLRSIDASLGYWRDAGFDVYDAAVFCDRVFRLTVSWAKWPNQYYYPDDNARMLLCYIPGLDVEINDIARPLFKMYGINVRDRFNEMSRVLENLCCNRGLKMCDLLSALTDARWSGTPSVHPF